MSKRTIPADFPRETQLASVSGALPKLAVRLVNGQYVSGLTDEEWGERYDGCEDLAQQCVIYCRRKVSENPALTQERCLANVRKGFALKVAKGAWDLTEAEQEWVVKRARHILGW